jgi:2-amino-4-hydroxy-6-hydroxymethyldihydropteridine diphosphokinase
MSPDSQRTVAAVGLGGNLGDPKSAMAQALQAIDRRADCGVLSVSRLFVTPPWGKTDQAEFFNCCALVETALEPEPLLDLCLSIERDMKRVRIERWGPRTIDLDVLTFGDRTMRSERLELPHPRMTERGFVLMPLADLAPEMLVEGRPVREWLTRADTAGIRIADDDRHWWRAG